VAPLTTLALQIGDKVMPAYECRFLDQCGNPVRFTNLRASNDYEARREAMTLLIRTGLFAGFELWDAELRIEVYRPSNHAQEIIAPL
jgi:hypothetical protein